MKTLIVRVKAPATDDGWPVELCVDDGTDNWHLKALEGTAKMPLALPPVVLPPQAGGQALAASAIVAYLLATARSVGFVSIGQYLFDVLHSSGIGAKWDDIRTKYETPNGPGLRTVFEIEPPDLRGLPWESLMNGNQAKFLDPDNPCVRGPINFAKGTDPYLVPLRVLVVVGDKDDTKLKWEEEVVAIRSGLLSFEGKVEVEFLLGPTPTQLVEYHAEFQPDVLHFIGHGIRSSTGLGPALILGNGEGGPKELIGPDIVSNLRTKTGRLAILNACRTGQAPNAAAAEVLNMQTWSLADAFRSAGYRSVVGMQADIPAAASVAFAGALYRTMGRGRPIAVAVAEARQRIGDGRPDVTVSALLLRDWVLPSLIVSAPPDHVLAPSYGVSDETLDQIEHTDEFNQIAGFVDRTRLRRKVSTRLGSDRSGESTSLMVVHGNDQVGKTWLVRHALRTCAWRGRAVHHVTFEGMSNVRLPEVLRMIRDGSSGSFISRKLPSEAADRLTHDLSFLSGGNVRRLSRVGRRATTTSCPGIPGS